MLFSSPFEVVLRSGDVQDLVAESKGSGCSVAGVVALLEEVGEAANEEGVQYLSRIFARSPVPHGGHFFIGTLEAWARLEEEAEKIGMRGRPKKML